MLRRKLSEWEISTDHFDPYRAARAQRRHVRALAEVLIGRRYGVSGDAIRKWVQAQKAQRSAQPQ